MKKVLVFISAMVLSLYMVSVVNAGEMKWVDGSGLLCSQACQNGNSNPVISGIYTNDEPFYVCRALERAGYNLNPYSATACTVGYGGGEIAVHTYDCLCHSNTSMESCLQAKGDNVVSECTASQDGSSVYGVTPQTNTWAVHQASAQAYGGNLVTINSEAENNFVATNFAPTYNVWIGLNDMAIESQWVWASQEPVSYTNWNPGEPNNMGGEDCAIMYHANRPTAAKTWNDITCNGGLLGVIEWND